jgi:hypothetical protein
VIESAPTGSAVVSKAAEFPLRDAVPSAVLPLLKVTMPVAVPPNCPETVAVKVTDCCKAEGVGNEINVVKEVALPTV